MLRGLGHFIESLDDADFPAPQEIVGADSRLPDVAEYLDRGLTREAHRGVSWCRFGCGEERMGHRDLTDGVWVWPEGLSHYVRQHFVTLPEDFIRQAHSGAMAFLPDKSEKVDWKDWIDWARPRRSPILRKSLLQARAEAGRSANLARDAASQRMTLLHGEGDRKCLQAACSGRALLGRLMCARHLPETSMQSDSRGHGFRLLCEVLAGYRP